MNRPDARRAPGENDRTPDDDTVVDPTDRPVPGHVLMPLLTRLTQESMDADYRVVAERRRAAGEATGAARSRSRRPWVTAVATGVFGVLLTVAAVQTSRNADVDALGRASLAERVTQEKAAVRDLQDRAGELLADNAAAEASLRELREREDQLTARVSRVGTRTGYLAVRGPGLRVTVDDPLSGGDIRVKDEDLHLLVDGLWAAGAEAIAVNGQRLTVVSPIQNTGGAIHVNVRPLNPPYVVEAVGDPDQMSGRLLASTNGSLFYAVARSLGFVLEVEDDDNLQLPAARVRTLRSAVPGASGDVSDE